MFDVETLWADFARPIVDRGRLRRLAARTIAERVLHGRARARAGRSSGDPPLDQRHGGDLPAGRAARARQRQHASSPAAAINRFLHVPTERERPRHEARDAARARPAHRHLLSALRRPGRDQRLPFGHLRHRCRRPAPTTTSASSRSSGARRGEYRHRRRHDRSQGRSLQAAASAGRSRSLPARRAPRRAGASACPAPRCTRPARSTRTG